MEAQQFGPTLPQSNEVWPVPGRGPEAGSACDSAQSPPAEVGKLVSGYALLAGVILPCICFALSFPEQPDWQSGQYSDYSRLLLSHRAALPLYPCLLYSMTCLSLLFWRPTRFARSGVVRCGVYCGVVLAAEYWVVFQFAISSPAAFVGQPVVAFCCYGLMWLVRTIWHSTLDDDRRFSAVGLIMLLIVPGIYLVPIVCMAALFSATSWAVATYALVSGALLRAGAEPHYRFGLSSLLGAMGWLAAHMACWRLSFAVMLEEYAQLPASRPQQCFVCSAAAAGHAGLVGGERFRLPAGGACRVNDQMRYLKAFELLLASLSPRLHRCCRAVYDVVGPRLAALLIHPLLADAGYLSLKPAEWLARLSLAVALPGRGQLVRALYPGDGAATAPGSAVESSGSPRFT